VGAREPIPSGVGEIAEPAKPEIAEIGQQQRGDGVALRHPFVLARVVLDGDRVKALAAQVEAGGDCKAPRIAFHRERRRSAKSRAIVSKRDGFTGHPPAAYVCQSERNVLRSTISHRSPMGKRDQLTQLRIFFQYETGRIGMATPPVSIAVSWERRRARQRLAAWPVSRRNSGGADWLRSGTLQPSTSCPTKEIFRLLTCAVLIGDVGAQRANSCQRAPVSRS
jgi:hypothetical protein